MTRGVGANAHNDRVLNTDDIPRRAPDLAEPRRVLPGAKIVRYGFK